MEILEILPDSGAKVLMSDLRILILSPDSQGTRTMSTLDGVIIGVVQRLYNPSAGQDLYLVIENPESSAKVHMEYLKKETSLNDFNDEWVELKKNNRWLLDMPQGLGVLERLYGLCPSIDKVREILEVIRNKGATERKRRVKAVIRVFELLEEPYLRELPENREFWLKSAVPILNALGIKFED